MLFDDDDHVNSFLSFLGGRAQTVGVFRVDFYPATQQDDGQRTTLCFGGPWVIR